MTSHVASGLLAAKRRLAGTLTGALCSTLLLATSGCGGGGDEDAAAKSKVSRAAASSLQQAMASSARAVDGVRGTRASLDHLSSSLQSALDQTGDVISLLTPRVAGSPSDEQLLKAARDQRSYLQFASSASTARTRGAGLSAVANARVAGGKAASDYSQLAVDSTELAGLLPASTSFATGRLRDAVLQTTKGKSTVSTKKSAGGAATSAPASSGAGCGGGVSVNSATSCPFGQNVAEAYNESGGSSEIDVYSPITKQSYTMHCTGVTPVVCSGGNNAVVYIR